MPKATETNNTEKVNARFIKRGDIIEQDGIVGTEVVRDISIILHMANGMDVVVKASDSVNRVPPEDLSGLTELVESPEN